MNIDGKVRSNLLPWNGHFSPQLIHALLEAYSHPCSTVLDCFLGSGTVLAEAGDLGLPALGAEINPAAFHLTQLYTLINAPPSERKAILDCAECSLHDLFDSSPLFAPGREDPDEATIKLRIIELWRSEKRPPCRRLFESLIILSDCYKPGLNGQRVLST